MNSTAFRPRGGGPSRGGITKRSTGRVRVDRDGDLDMDSPAGGARGGRGGGRGRGAFSRGGVPGSGPPRGPAADRPRGGGGSGAMRGNPRRDPVGTRAPRPTYQPPGRRPGGPHVNEGPTVEVRVEGWRESKGGADECISFLERKTKMTFKKTSKQGNTIILYVPLSKIGGILEWDNVQFASSHLRLTAPNLNNITSSIESRSNAIISQAAPKSRDTVDTIKTLEQVLANRYNIEAKILDLSKLGEDPLLKQNGFFELSSTTSKMFPALMQIADKRFQTAQQKRDTVHSVSLAYNSLKDLRAVTTLSVTFPDLKNLSLQGNLIEGWQALDSWRNRFKNLEQLVLMGNPLTRQPDYKQEAMRRFPALVMLDNVPLDRPAIKIGDEARRGAGPGASGMSGAVDEGGRPVMPLRTKGKFIQDDHGVAMGFLSTFFATYDNDKNAVLSQFYDSASTFSMSVNTSAPRVEAQQNTRQWWDPWIPISRNLKRNHSSGFMSARVFTGPDAIGHIWGEIPSFRHNLGNEELWSFDVWPIEVLGAGGIMVGGIMCCVHGEFEESNGDKFMKRSFDRTFILRPDANGAVKVGNDILVVRSYGGFESWKEEPEAPVPVQAPMAAPVGIPMAAPVGMPMAAAPVGMVQDPNMPQGQAAVAQTEQQQNMAKCFEFARRSGLKMEWAELCLTETGWNLEEGWTAFVQANAAGNIPQDAFDPNIPRPF
ncbi:uncharacterized protein LAJ45_07697 [Morchella importuna]|uniref:uncharacterized protein n=1 Tax=Morchella importuna TaxID=1174673 RepID=UPI001E8E9E4D|nr:uncharacterized protein LAJ45_07697 [Morchella importuna]KAH8148245.1 hypothetical protein LAJ45_07697 [Morchella importuna]